MLVDTAEQRIAQLMARMKVKDETIRELRIDNERLRRMLNEQAPPVVNTLEEFDGEVRHG